MSEPNVEAIRLAQAVNRLTAELAAAHATIVRIDERVTYIEKVGHGYADSPFVHDLRDLLAAYARGVRVLRDHYRDDAR